MQTIIGVRDGARHGVRDGVWHESDTDVRCGRVGSRRAEASHRDLEKLEGRPVDEVLDDLLVDDRHVWPEGLACDRP